MGRRREMSEVEIPHGVHELGRDKLGIGLLGHAANLLIFTIAGLTRARPPILTGAAGDFAGLADPVPQALILTAIVIGFAVQAFAVVLVHRVIQVVGTDDLDEMKATDT